LSKDRADRFRGATKRDREIAMSCAAKIHEYWVKRGVTPDLDLDQHGVISSDIKLKATEE